MNHSQGRNISDYNNTLSMNRSMLNNNTYSNNTPMRSRRSPLQINPNEINTLRYSNIGQQQQRNETEAWDKTKGFHFICTFLLKINIAYT